MPDAHAELMKILRELESHYKDMQDTEFTVEEGQLYMLQTRNAKRPAQAAVRFAVDAVERGAADPRGGDRDDRRRVARRAAPPDLRARRASTRCLATRRRRVARRREGRRSSSPPTTRSPPRRRAATSILVRPFTEADDVAGFFAAKGILTSEGGKASHAALVARGMGRPAVVRRLRPRDRPEREDRAA